MSGKRTNVITSLSLLKIHQLKKTTHSDPDRIRQVFLRGLRGLSRKRPEEILQFAFVASDCLWRCIQSRTQKEKESAPITESTEPPVAELISPQRTPGLQATSDAMSVDNTSHEDPVIIQDLTTGLVRDVYIKTERHFISMLLDEKMKSGAVGDGDLFAGLLTLWDGWLSAEAQLLKVRIIISLNVMIYSALIL